MSKIEKGKVSFEDPVWKDISAEGKAFVKRLLKKDFKKRVSAELALSDKWLRMHQNTKLEVKVLKSTLDNLFNFAKHKKL